MNVHEERAVQNQAELCNLMIFSGTRRFEWAEENRFRRCWLGMGVP